MPQLASPGVEPKLLHRRLAALRLRLRCVATFRGLSWLIVVLFLSAAAGGVLDWRVHLPGVIRALILTGGLSAAGFVIYRHLFRPLWARSDDLSLALRIEEHYPALNDCLASTVQFLEVSASRLDRSSSASLRREAVHRSLHQAEGCNFNRVVDSRGLRLAGLSMVVAGGVAVALVMLYPAQARTALLRLANPFGGVDWPRQTQLEITFTRSRLARNEPFEIRGIVRGVVPEKATVVYRFEGASPLEHSSDIARGDGGASGTFQARLEPNRVQRNFFFQVRANDAVSPWYGITVLPPPLLVPLDGRASPQVRLDYPPYTDLTPQHLPEGIGNVEAVAGTRVSLRAATDRPLARAWIEFKYQPEPDAIKVAALLGPLAAQHSAGVLATTASGQALWDDVPARLEGDGRVFAVSFLPRASGMYALHFEDETGLRSYRLFELHVNPDPAPTVHLERPSPKLDTLEMLPDAEFTLRVVAEDPVFAVRSVFVEYRCRNGTANPQPAGDEPPRRLPLYDHQAAVVASQLLPPLAQFPAAPSMPARLKQQQVLIERRFSLGEFRHLNPVEAALKEGDVLVLQACADDFDDVTANKQPGRSHEIEIRIVDRNALEIHFGRDQGKIQQDLVRLREQQREALKKVTNAEKTQNQTGKLPPEDVEQLLQAEQLQQQIRERIGNREEGLRAEAQRLLETLENNHIPRSATHERMEAVAGELERLAREELEQIEPRLTNARKQAEAGDPKPGDKKEEKLLGEARQHQEEVEKTLSDLLARLEPWSSTREIKMEAKSLLQEQRRLNEAVDDLQKKHLGAKLEELTPTQRADVEKSAAAQQKLQERTSQLLEKMQRLGKEREQKDPETAKELQKAFETGKQSDVTGLMQKAQREISQNGLSQASKSQRDAADKLEKLVQELEDRREAELDRLAKKLRQMEEKLEELSRQQDELQKKAKAAAQIADPEKRKEELKRLARQQQDLQEKAQDMAKQLSRMRSERSSQALGRAAEQMEQAGAQLQRGENPDEQQDEALDRLDDAQRELERAREGAEEELAREQLGKIADTIKRLKERQVSLVAESGRIHKEALQNKGWTRELRLFSLRDLANNQKALGGETQRLAEEKLSGAKVFAKIMHKAGRAMEEAGNRLEERRQQALQKPDDTQPDEEAARLQQQALRRLVQLLDAIKEQQALAQRPPQPKKGQKGGDQGDEQGSPPPGDGIPGLAQLKLLRALQAEVNQRTEEFGKQHPDLGKLNEKEQAELHGIRRDQQEVADLFNELTPPAEGDKP